MSSTRLLLASVDAGLRRAHLAARLRDANLSELLPELERIHESSQLGAADARSALWDLIEVLGRNASLRERLQLAAGSSALGRWLAAQPRDPGRAPEPTLRDASGRLLTLGEKKTLARVAPAELLPRLLLDVELSVVARALAHPRLTEDVLVRVMSKRPGSATLLGEAALSGKWMQRARVRRVLVMHPDTPAERARMVLPLLLRQELEQVVAVARVPLPVREEAARRLERGE